MCAGSVEVTAELAQELLEASDQYMLETLKVLCEMKIADELAPDNVSAVSAGWGWGGEQLGKGRCKQGLLRASSWACWAGAAHMLDCLQAWEGVMLAALLLQAFDLAENFNAPQLSKRCALFCLVSSAGGPSSLVHP